MKHVGLTAISALSIMAMTPHLATAQTQTVNGSINATMTLTSACAVNGTTASGNMNFGTLDFGSETTLFTEATTQLAPTGNGSTLVVQCTAGLNASLAVVSGQNDAAVPGSLRAMENGGLFIPYDIYSDSGFQTIVNNSSSFAIPTDGTPLALPIYGRALGITGLTPGTYTDIISLTLSF